ncbi:hypothetical protein ACHAWF_015033 [Thalassiosira exigua]
MKLALLSSVLLAADPSAAFLLPRPASVSVAPPARLSATAEDVKEAAPEGGAPPSSSSAAPDAAAPSDLPTPDPSMPPRSPATSLPNEIYSWRGHAVRYQASGPPDADRAVLLVHGLFVNSDHWRKALTGLNDASPGGGRSEGKKKGVRVYALDLLGSGWSSKPARDCPVASAANGENGRFVGCDSICYRERPSQPQQQQSQQQSQQRRRSGLKKARSSPSLPSVPLGTSAGGHRVAPSLDLRHPLGSPYNFYTWAEQVADFARDVVGADFGDDAPAKVTLVANSIGTMSALQAMTDEPDLFDGCLVVNPNFRELHMAEVPLSFATMPLVRTIQSALRENGKGLFEALATKDAVAQILKEPYAVADAIDDELVEALLTPLLTPGADDVVFDTLSYSAGPLPEQQLASPAFPRDKPVWVLYGREDPWTPSKRVENLKNACSRPDGTYGEGPVERIVGVDGAGHCPHDEDPERVHELIWEFLERLDGLLVARGFFARHPRPKIDADALTAERESQIGSTFSELGDSTSHGTRAWGDQNLEQTAVVSIFWFVGTATGRP